MAKFNSVVEQLKSKDAIMVREVQISMCMHRISYISVFVCACLVFLCVHILMAKGTNMVRWVQICIRMHCISVFLCLHVHVLYFYMCARSSQRTPSWFVRYRFLYVC